MKNFKLLILLIPSLCFLAISCGGGSGGGSGGVASLGGSSPEVSILDSYGNIVEKTALAITTEETVSIGADGGIAPYSYEVVSGPGEVTNSGAVSISDTGDDFAEIEVTCTDSTSTVLSGQADKVTNIIIPVLGTPSTWLKLDNIATEVGTTVSSLNDSSSNDNDATVSDGLSGPTLIQEGTEVSFNGTDQQLKIPNNLSEDFTIVLTFSSIAGAGSDWSDASSILDASAVGIADDFGIYLTSDGKIGAAVGDTTGGSDVEIASDTGFNDGEDHIVIFTRNNTTGEIILKVDGVDVASTTGPSATLLNASAEITIGSNTSNSNFFDGTISEVLTYSELLQDSESLIVERYLIRKDTNTSISASFVPTVTIESAPTALDANSTASFTFSSTPSEYFDLAGYECQVDSGGFSSCSESQSFTLADGAHSLDVRSIDTDDRVSVVATHNWTIDSTAPICSLTATPDVISSATTEALGFSCTDADTMTYECKLNTGDWVSCDSSTTHTYSSLTDNNYIFYLRVTDAAGNISNIETVTWMTVATGPQCSFESSFTSTINESETISFTCQTPVEVTNVECKLDAGAWEDCDSKTSHAVSGMVDQQNYELRIRGTDNYFNTGAEAAFNWGVDQSAPTLSITSTAYVSSTQREISFTAEDTTSGIAQSECRFNSGDWEICTSPHTMTVAIGTSLKWEVRTTNNSGMASTTEELTETYIVGSRLESECIAEGGTLDLTSNACKFTSAGDTTCPAGWTQYQNWREYAATTCGTVTDCSSTCTTGSSAWDDSSLAPADCSYDNGEADLWDWSWTSYGHSVDEFTDGPLLSGTIEDSASAICPKAETESDPVPYWPITSTRYKRASCDSTVKSCAPNIISCSPRASAIGCE